MAAAPPFRRIGAFIVVALRAAGTRYSGGLYLATTLQVLNDILECIIRFRFPSFEFVNIAGVFSGGGSLFTVVTHIALVAVLGLNVKTLSVVLEKAIL